MHRVLAVITAGFLMALVLAVGAVLADPGTTCAATAGCPADPNAPWAACEPVDGMRSSPPPNGTFLDYEGVRYWCAEW